MLTRLLCRGSVVYGVNFHRLSRSSLSTRSPVLHIPVRHSSQSSASKNRDNAFTGAAFGRRKMPKNKFITAIINSTILLVIGCGASLFYQKYQQKAKRLGKIDRVISPSPCFKVKERRRMKRYLGWSVYHSNDIKIFLTYAIKLMRFRAPSRKKILYVEIFLWQS